MAVWRDKARDKFRYDFTHRGVRHHGYCEDPETGAHATSKRDARRIEGLIRTQVKKAEEGAAAPVRRPQPSGFTLAQSLSEYMNKAQLENRSWKNAIPHVRELLASFGEDRTLDSIFEADIERYRTFALQQPVTINASGPRKGHKARPTRNGRLRKKSTVNRHLNTLRAAWNLSYRLHLPKMPGFPRPPTINDFKENEYLPRPVTDADIGRILARSAKDYPHVFAAVIIAVHTGLRLREVLRLVWEEIVWDSCQIRLKPRTKNGAERSVPMNGVCLKLMRCLQKRAPEPRNLAGRVILYRHRGVGAPKPIDSIKTALRKILIELELDGRHTFRDLRASFATALAERGVEVLKLMELMGHADVRTTLRYIKVADPVKVEAVARIEDRPGTRDALQLMTDAPRSIATEVPYFGVYPKKGRYEAKIAERHDGATRVRYLGLFLTSEDAARAYDDAARQHPGRKLNFPEPDAPHSAPDHRSAA